MCSWLKQTYLRLPESDEKQNALESFRKLKRTLIILTRLWRIFKTLPDPLILILKKLT